MEKLFKITAETGLHARPATVLVNEAVRFDSEVYLSVNDKEVNMKSIMGVMSLGIYSGEVIKVTAEGDDAEEALTAITKIIVGQKLGKEI